MSRSDDLVKALVNARIGGFLAQPPDLAGDPGLGIAAITGIPRGRTWDAVVSAHAHDVVGDTVSFVTLADGTIVVDDDQPDGSLAPLAEAVEERLPPPYRAAAVRHDGDVWSVVAEDVEIVELPDIEGETIDLTLVGAERELKIDDTPVTHPLPALDARVETEGDVAVHAERVDGNTFAVDVFPL